MFPEKIKILKNLYDSDDFIGIEDIDDLITEDQLPIPYIHKETIMKRIALTEKGAKYSTVGDVILYLTPKSYNNYLLNGVIEMEE